MRELMNMISATELDKAFNFHCDMWNKLGIHCPYYSVVTLPEFEGELSREKRDAFYHSGEVALARIETWLEIFDCRLEPHWDVLEFGCGCGRLLLPLAGKVNLAVGCDISYRHMRIAEMEAEERGITKAEFVITHYNLFDKFVKGSFDFIYSILVLQHIPSILTIHYIKQLAQILKPGGVMYFQCFTTDIGYTDEAEDLSMLGTKDDIHMYTTPHKQILQAIRDGGMYLVKTVTWKNPHQPDFEYSVDRQYLCKKE